MDIAHAWFIHMQTRDLSDFHPSKKPPSTTKEKSTEQCMVKTHLFISKFFADEDWIKMYEDCNLFYWGDMYDLSIQKRGDYKNQILLRIEMKRFYHLYHSFVKQFYSSSKPRDAGTFEKECEEAGIILHLGKNKRKHVNGKKKSCVDLYFSLVEAQLLRLYPELSFDWPHVFEYNKIIDVLGKKQTNEPDKLRTSTHSEQVVV